MKVNQIVKKYKISKVESIRLQILIWCFLRNIQVTPTVLDMLTTLSMVKSIEVSKFCTTLTKTSLFPNQKNKSFSGKERESGTIFKSPQSARNTVLKAIEQGLILRGKKHEIYLNPSIGIADSEDLLVNYQFLSLGTS